MRFERVADGMFIQRLDFVRSVLTPVGVEFLDGSIDLAEHTVKLHPIAQRQRCLDLASVKRCDCHARCLRLRSSVDSTETIGRTAYRFVCDVSVSFCGRYLSVPEQLLYFLQRLPIAHEMTGIRVTQIVDVILGLIAHDHATLALHLYSCPQSGSFADLLP